MYYVLYIYIYICVCVCVCVCVYIYIYIYIYISQKWVHPSHFCKYFIISFQVTTLKKWHFAVKMSKLGPKCQYFVWPPLFSSTALTLFWAWSSPELHRLPLESSSTPPWRHHRTCPVKPLYGLDHCGAAQFQGLSNLLIAYAIFM